MERFSDLDTAFKQSWDMLYQASVNRNDPMRTPALATLDKAKPQVRTIVLRGVAIKERELLCFSDRRSPKVSQILETSTVEYLFYDPKEKIQIRASGETKLEWESETCRGYWKKLNIAGRSSYAAEVLPGATQEVDASGLPPNWSATLPLQLTDYAFENFCLLKTTVHYMDVLHLHSEGHQRAGFWWEGEAWKQSWLIP